MIADVLTLGFNALLLLVSVLLFLLLCCCCYLLVVAVVVDAMFCFLFVCVHHVSCRIFAFFVYVMRLHECICASV